MSKKNPKRYDPAFKARVALEAAQEQESLAQIGPAVRGAPGAGGPVEEAAARARGGRIPGRGAEQRRGAGAGRAAQEDRGADGRAGFFSAWAAALPVSGAASDGAARHMPSCRSAASASCWAWRGRRCTTRRSEVSAEELALMRRIDADLHRSGRSTAAAG